MDSEHRANSEQRPTDKWTFPLMGTVVFGSIAILIKLLNRHADVKAFLLIGLAVVGWLTLISFLKPTTVTALLSAISIILMVMALLARATDSHLSSFTFVAALFTFLGTLANFSIPKIQNFLYQCGYRPNLSYPAYLDGSVVGDTWPSHDTSIGDSGCSFGDGGSCDGG